MSDFLYYPKVCTNDKLEKVTGTISIEKRSKTIPAGNFNKRR